jgi:hypothetical protein
MKKWIFISWIVTWTYTTQYPYSCPEPAPTINPYSGKLEASGITNLLYCYHVSTSTHYEEFSTKEEAQKFIAGCSESERFGPWEGCSDIKIREAK